MGDQLLPSPARAERCTEPQRIIGDLLTAEIEEKETR